MTMPGPEQAPHRMMINGEKRGINIAMYELEKFHERLENDRLSLMHENDYLRGLEHIAKAAESSPVAGFITRAEALVSGEATETERLFRIGSLFTIAAGLSEGHSPHRAVEILASPVQKGEQSFSFTEWAMTCDQNDLNAENCRQVLSTVTRKPAA